MIFSRFLLASFGFICAIGVKPEDILYNTLPLYHSLGMFLFLLPITNRIIISFLGGWVCITHRYVLIDIRWEINRLLFSLLGGCTTVLRKKFSASNFWKDCVKYKCTVSVALKTNELIGFLSFKGFTYVGELCRFLLAQPPSDLDRQHSLRFCAGNGLRQSLWMPFVERFGIKTIYEFYGATESNAYFCKMKIFFAHLVEHPIFLSVNLDSRPGSIGFFSVLLPRVLGSLLVRFDPETMEPLRDPQTQLCIPCETGERGLLLGMIKTSIFNAYDGYVNNPSGTNKKIVENVYQIGDRAFNTGRRTVGFSRKYFHRFLLR